MITLKELHHFLDHLLEPQLFTDFGKNGLQIEGKTNIAKIATAVSADLQTIKKAIEQGVDALIVHHGLFWGNECPMITGIFKEKIQLCLKNELSLFSYHLPLDAHREIGNNWKAAIDLEWIQLDEFLKMGGIPIGVKGEFAPISIQDFVKKIENYYQSHAHKALGGKEMVSSAAIVSGGAYKNIKDAKESGVDCFITGNFDEPAWSQAHELGIHFLALGHTATEKVGPKALQKLLQNKLSVNTSFIDTNNPF